MMEVVAEKPRQKRELRSKQQKKIELSVGGEYGLVQKSQTVNGLYYVTMKGLGDERVKETGGLLDHIQDVAVGQRLKYKYFKITTSGSKSFRNIFGGAIVDLVFENVEIEISTKKIKVYFSDPSLYMRLVKTIPFDKTSLATDSWEKSFPYRMEIWLSEFTKADAILAAVKFA